MTSSRTGGTGARRRLLILLVIGLWSAVPPFISELDVPTSVEIVDHVVPGLVAAAGAMAALRATAAGRPDGFVALAGVGACTLAGVWETATHVSVVLDAGEPGRPAGTVALHAVPGVALLGLGAWTLLTPAEQET